MSLDPALRERIAGILASHRVVLFMKGTRAAPRCGFSAGAVGTLDGLLEAYHDIDVLADADLREGIKAYGNWPTIPQLYVGGELVGGSDIIQQLAFFIDDIDVIDGLAVLSVFADSGNHFFNRIPGIHIYIIGRHDPAHTVLWITK